MKSWDSTNLRVDVEPVHQEDIMDIVKKFCRYLVLCQCAVLAAAAVAQDGADVGLVNQLAGKVSYGAGANANLSAQAFMKVRQGDRFVLPADSSLRLVYFASGRQESWQGPASLRAGAQGSEVLNGKPPVITMLPTSVPQRMARIPDLVQGARLGGVVVRGGGGGRPSGPIPAEVELARGTYKSMRAQASPEDVTPELFLISVLQDFGYVDEMGPVADEMLKRQPDTPEVRELAKWVQMRINTPR
jgi:hypothetical protein